MTKVTILGQEPKEKELKKIEFVSSINYEGKVLVNPILKPYECDSINVYLRTQAQEWDLFVCYKCKTRHTYLGHFNDGIV